MFNNTSPAIAISSNERAVPKMDLNGIVKASSETPPIVQGLLNPNYGIAVLTSGILIGTLITLTAFALFKKQS